MEFALSGLAFFEPSVATRKEMKSATRDEDEAAKEKRIFCAACRHLVTHQDERISVGGSHEHTCTNPAGLAFRIGCFREAGGCVAIGEATTEHTWFEGCAWRVALCAKCERHLGWRFLAPADDFHGLIVDRLSSVGEAPS